MVAWNFRFFYISIVNWTIAEALEKFIGNTFVQLTLNPSRLFDDVATLFFFQLECASKHKNRSALFAWKTIDLVDWSLIEVLKASLDVLGITYNAYSALKPIWWKQTLAGIIWFEEEEKCRTYLSALSSAF